MNANINASLSTAERDALVAGLNAMTETRATVLKKVADDPDFVRERSQSGVCLDGVIGYLRRNPDDLPDLNSDGFNFWLAKLNQCGGDFRKADMVKSFLFATGYRVRFGQP